MKMQRFSKNIYLFGLYKMPWVENSFSGVFEWYDWVCLWPISGRENDIGALQI
jgi:hypothetical protein